jgi:hypothetical protein
MLATDIKKMNRVELEELLAINTKELSISYELINDSFANVLSYFVEEDNTLSEEIGLWKNIFMHLYGFEDRIIDALSDTMGAFPYILWCRDNLINKKEVALYIELYKKYREQKLSTANFMGTVIDLLIQGLADSDPESISSLMQQLEGQLNKLPDFIKDDLDLKSIK